jgi:hypothetical protein
MQTVKTKYGTFRLSRKDAIGLSVYKSGRQMTINRTSIGAGDYFPIFHRTEEALSKPPSLRLYGGDFVGRFRLDGTEIKSGSYVIDWKIK